VEFPQPSAEATVAQPKLTRVVQQLRVACAGRADETDRALLERFTRSRDEKAFAVLVRRHGRLVRAACQQVLTDPAEIDDAFQATFVVLLQKARSVRWKESLGSWLYAVAHRVAVHARANALRRRQRESQAGRRKKAEARPDDLSWREACAVLHEELDRLPDRYRRPLLLCYLQGQSRDEAAVSLGWTPGAVKGCLERGRQTLATRLARRGITLSAGLLAVVTGSSAAAGGLPPNLVQLALQAANGQASPAVAALAQGASPMVLAGKKSVLSVLALVALLGAGVGFRQVETSAQEKQPPTGAPGKAAAAMDKPESKPPPPPDAPAEAPLVETMVAGTVTDPQGKPVAGAKVFWVEERWPLVRPQPRATTGRDGRFAFSVRHPAWERHPSLESHVGRHGFLFITADGFGAGWARISGADPTKVVIWVAPDDPPLSGKVIDLEGRPVAGVRLTVRQLGMPRDGKDLSSSWLDNVRQPHPDQPMFLAELINGFLIYFRMYPSTVTGPDGRFLLRGVGRERSARLLLEGDAVRTQEVDVLTRSVEWFTAQVNGERRTYFGTPCTLVVAPSQPIVGTVRDKDTGKPIPGARIAVKGVLQSLQSEIGGVRLDALEFVTDREGRYRITGMPGKEKNHGMPWHVRPPAWAPYPELVLSTTPETARQVATPFDIEMKRGIELNVKVMDKQTGQPVPGACSYYPVQDNPFLEQYPGYVADQQFYMRPSPTARLIAIPGRGVVAVWRDDGPYLLGVLPDSLRPYVEDRYLRAAPNSFPVASFRSYAEVNLEPGAESATVTVALDPGLSVPATVLGPDGRELPGAVTIGRELRMSYFDPVPLPGARFDIYALRPEEKRRVIVFHTEKKLAGSVLVTGGQSERAVIKLEPWGEVTGRLVDDSGRPIQGSFQTAFSDGACYTDLARGASPVCQHGSLYEVAADGRFRLTGLAPGLKYGFHFYTYKRGREHTTAALEVVVKPSEVKDLGDVRLLAPKPPGENGP
jgi:RNA polymerase sigma factor (sigma-70 family)